MGPDSQVSAILSQRLGTPMASSPPTVQECQRCEVTWRAHVGAPCWYCGRAGTIANPDRRVLD